MEKILKADKIEENTPGKGVRVEGIEKAVLDFVPADGISLSRILGAWYNKYTQAGALALTIAANSIVGAAAILPIQVNGNAITITGATQHPANTTTASTTAGDTDEYVFWKTSTGIYYAINNLGQ